MAISADEFLKTAKQAKRSRLDPFRDDILKLKNADVTNIEICRFLQMNGVEISAAGLGKYLRRLASKSIQTSDKVNVTINKKSVSSEKEKMEADKSKQKHDAVKPPSWAPQVSLNDLI